MYLQKEIIEEYYIGSNAIHANTYFGSGDDDLQMNVSHEPDIQI